MAESVSTTFSVSVGIATDLYTPSAEIDTRTADKEGLNARVHGYTSGFKPADAIYFIVYVGDKYRVKNIRVSAGSVAKHTGGNNNILIEEENITFAEGRASTASLSKPSTTLNTQKWFGQEVGALSIDEDRTTVKTPTIPTADANQSIAVIEAAREPFLIPGIAQVSYNTQVEFWKLTAPSYSEIETALLPKRAGEFPIHIAIECELIE